MIILNKERTLKIGMVIKAERKVKKKDVKAINQMMSFQIIIMHKKNSNNSKNINSLKIWRKKVKQ